MSLFNFFAPKTTPPIVERLGQETVEYSIGVVNEVLSYPELLNKDLIGNAEIQIALYEVATFYLFYIASELSEAFGETCCKELMDKLLANVEMKFAAGTIASLEKAGKKVDDALRKTINDNFYCIFTSMGSKFEKCSSFFNEETSCLKRHIGGQPTALITCLTDDLYEIFKGEPVAFDIAFSTLVKGSVASTLNQLSNIIESI